MDRRAREVWDAIASETGSRKAQSQKIARLYAVARDIQRAQQGGARDVTTHKMIGFLMLVLARTYGIGVGR